jgi:peptidoglycan/LPS O-acetylase OafA/YrhL
MKTPRPGTVLSALGAVVLVVLVVDLGDTDHPLVYGVSGIAAGLSLLGAYWVVTRSRPAASVRTLNATLFRFGLVVAVVGASITHDLGDGWKVFGDALAGALVACGLVVVLRRRRRLAEEAPPHD